MAQPLLSLCPCDGQIETSACPTRSASVRGPAIYADLLPKEFPRIAIIRVRVLSGVQQTHGVTVGQPFIDLDGVVAVVIEAVAALWGSRVDERIAVVTISRYIRVSGRLGT